MPDTRPQIRLTGFTLVEALVVLMILAILLALAIPNTAPKVTRVQLTEVLKYADNLKPAIESSYKSTHMLPADNLAAGLPTPDKLVSNLVTRVDIEQGAIQITLGNNAHSLLQGQVLSLQPLTVISSDESPLDWTCGWSKIPAGMETRGINRTTIKPALLPFSCIGNPAAPH